MRSNRVLQAPPRSVFLVPAVLSAWELDETEAEIAP